MNLQIKLLTADQLREWRKIERWLRLQKELRQWKRGRERFLELMRDARHPK